MKLMHHNELRVNAEAPADDDVMEIYHERGWRQGPHRDTDPDDPAPIPRVLPEPDPTSDPPVPRSRSRSTTTKKKD